MRRPPLKDRKEEEVYNKAPFLDILVRAKV